MLRNVRCSLRTRSDPEIVQPPLWPSEGTVSWVWKVGAKGVGTHGDHICHDRFCDATCLIPYHMYMRARRGFNRSGSGGKDMGRASRIVTLVNGQRSCPNGEKHRSRVRVPAAETTRLKRDDLRRHINRLIR